VLFRLFRPSFALLLIGAVVFVVVVEVEVDDITRWTSSLAIRSEYVDDCWVGGKPPEPEGTVEKEGGLSVDLWRAVSIDSVRCSSSLFCGG
jgi:hypothetical protein